MMQMYRFVRNKQTNEQTKVNYFLGHKKAGSFFKKPAPLTKQKQQTNKALAIYSFLFKYLARAVISGKPYADSDPDL